MAKRHRSSAKVEMLSRNVLVSSFRATVRLRTVHHRGEEPYIESQPWLELHGTLTEPVRDVRDARISMYPKDTLEIGTARPAAVGAVIQTRPEFGVVLTWPRVDFDRVWAMAIDGCLTHAHLYLTRPHYGSGLVVSASFSNEAEE